jgi:hypothetical protein
VGGGSGYRSEGTLDRRIASRQVGSDLMTVNGSPAPESGALRRSRWARLADVLYGYDYFIAYRRTDGASYAAALHEKLSAKNPGSTASSTGSTIRQAAVCGPSRHALSASRAAYSWW